jgi:hypothetical protein
MTVTTKPTNGVPSETKSCSLDPITAALVKLLFDHDMFKEALVNMEIGSTNTLLNAVDNMTHFRYQENAIGQAEQIPDSQGVRSAGQNSGCP